MGLVFCKNCGCHDVCPMEMIGDTVSRCDMCGKEAVFSCGECEACLDEFDDTYYFEEEDFEE